MIEGRFLKFELLYSKKNNIRSRMILEGCDTAKMKNVPELPIYRFPCRARDYVC